MEVLKKLIASSKVCLSDLEFLSLLSLYCSLSKYNFHVLHHFKYKFSSILSWGTIFLNSVVKMTFHLVVLMFSWQEPPVSHVHQFFG
jgi:hypothetical protein